MAYRIVAFLKKRDETKVLEELATKDEGMQRMKNWFYSQAIWIEYGERMDYLQLQGKQDIGEWEKVSNVG